MANKSIVILSYYYHPQITPRAFRAKELAAEFIKRKWHVTLITPNGVYENDEILALHRTEQTRSIPNKESRPSVIKTFIANTCRRLLPGGKDLIGSFNIVRHGAKTKINADIALSIGLPFSVHLATFILRKTKSLRAVRFIADYGDPYSAMEKRYKGCIYAPYIERVVLRGFDEITVPLVKAKLEFRQVTEIEKIYVSPQGLDLTQFTISKYEPDPVKIRCAYAGLFYSDIRNPSVLFDHLKTLNNNIELHLYTRPAHEATRQVLEKYKSINSIVLHEPLSRERCVYELSKYDFLINIENEIDSQIPSKLIDYSIAGRPIFSFKPSSFDAKKFDAFLYGNYSSSVSFDPTLFSIVTVANNLIDKKNHV